MTGLRAALAGYLTLRRALGCKLAVAERLLRQFPGFMEAHDARMISPRTGEGTSSGPSACRRRRRHAW